MTSPAEVPLLVLDHLSRTFNVDDTSGIRDVSLSINHGEFVAIVGPSGAGKSTLLNILGLLDRPTNGRYFFHGTDTGKLSEKRRDELRSRSIGFVFQSSFVLGDARVIDNAAMGLRIQQMPYRERRELATEALTRIGIAGRSSTDARLLSGGERQRLAIARAIATDPKLLLADEPTGNLDSANSGLILEHLRELNLAGTTVILITHDLEIAAQADRIIHIADGRLLTDSPTDTTGIRVANRVRDQQKVLPHRWRRGLIALADDLAESALTLVSRMLRTVLLVLAFALGIGGLIAAVGVSESASAQVTQRLTAAALDEVRVTLPGGVNLLRDPEELDQWISSARALPHVVDVGYVAQTGATSAGIRRIDNGEAQPSASVQLVTASPTYLRLVDATADGPNSVGLLDSPQVDDVALVGQAASDNLNLPGPGPGSTIWVNDRRVSVVGRLIAGDRSPAIANTVIVSRDVLAASTSATVTLLVRTEPGYPAPVADAIPTALDPINPGRFNVETVADLRNLRYGVSSDLGTLLGLTAGVLLALATISASTTMYLSVQARSSEIALRRAIGASKNAIARLFLVEGFTIGVIGGITGAVVGTTATIVASTLQTWNPILDAGLIPVSIIIGAATGVVSAIIPAWAAGRQEPAIAIRN
ncbi:ATP-binding cassette domain-containing protein [Agreia pratensis]|uniref:ABC transporter ATP-binding protein/permease n=1 Tax=Agreia pratensis TaxID=150121 RepID=UPI00188A10E3|nr:ABC transporter ATP-binding protein/permease [Agreia pratensis]MBF4636241.1 ATP-binding cassette domain-containing protein [Agreia pratensis]